MKKIQLFIAFFLLTVINLNSPITVFANNNHLFQIIDEKKVTVNAKDKTLDEIMTIISKQAKIGYAYDNTSVDKNKKMSLTVSNISVKETLNKLFAGTNYQYRLKDNMIIISLKQAAAATNTKAAEKWDVNGKIIDSDRKSVVGAMVTVKSSGAGAISNEDGVFALKVNNNDVLEISFVGMIPQEYVVKHNDKNIIIELKRDIIDAGDVVVTGIMERKAESYTGSATTIKGDELKRVGNQNVFQSLKNIDPTIYIMDNLQMGSNPNALPEMNMRGGTSFPTNAINSDLKGNYENKPNQPLFILDGFEASVERIFDLDMNLVESLTILKDAAAKALYGSKAANGVVVIETKKLLATKPRFTYTGSLDLTMPDLSSYDLCNALEKLDVEFAEDVFPDTNKTALDNYYTLRKKVLDGMDTYWLSKPVQFGYGHKHSINVELGKDELRTSLNISYSDNVGVMKKSGRKNLSGLFNIQYVLNNKLKFQNSLSITNNHSKDTPYGSFSQYTLLNPYYDIYDEFGQLAVTIGNSGNPYRDGEINTKLTGSYFQFTNNFNAEWNIVDNLKLKGRVGITSKTSDADQYYPSTHSKFNSYKGDDIARKGSYQANYGKSSTLTAEVFLNYYKVVKEKHNFLFNVGVNLQETVSKETIHYTEGFPSDNMDDIMFAVQYMKDMRPSGIAQTKRETGLLGTFSYSYDNKYLFDATVRSNGSSMFGNDNRWATFWSLGIGWNLHKEKFMRDLTWMKQFKIRASIGTTGNQNFQNNKSLAVNNFYLEDRYQGLIGSYLGNMENPQLKWEQKLDYNLGVDAEFLGINIKFDIYKSKTKDLVTSKGIAPSTGFTTVSENLGTVENKGFEIIASYTPIQKQNGFLRVNGSISRNKDKIIKISEAMRKFNENQAKLASESGADIPVPQYQDGMSMNTIYAVQSLGIDPVIGLEMYRKRNGEKTYIWRASDMVPSGIDVPLYRGTIGLVGEYRGIGVSVTARYLGGGQMYNETLVRKIDNADIKSNFDRRVLTERWSGVNKDAYFKRYKKEIPYSLTSGTYSPGRESNNMAVPPTKSTQRFVQNQNELDISSVSLYYDFNKRLISKIGFERLKISAIMNDVVKFSTIGIERGTTYPFARTVTFQLSATF